MAKKLNKVILVLWEDQYNDRLPLKLNSLSTGAALFYVVAPHADEWSSGLFIFHTEPDGTEGMETRGKPVPGGHKGCDFGKCSE